MCLVIGPKLCVCCADCWLFRGVEWAGDWWPLLGGDGGSVVVS